MPLFSCIPFGCHGGVDIIDRTQCGLEEIPPEVERNAHTLEELYLNCNQIFEISEKVARCRKLRTLSLAHNKLLRVPSFIGCLKALEELHLEDNELTDLPLELKDCTNLQVLDLRLNVFLRLPDVISRLDSLTQLHLFETSLTQLPPDIGYLQNLRYLDIRENQLRVLPPSICDLRNLKELDVGRNELLLLPMGLGVLERLEELYADHNLLNAIPDSVVDCRMLKVLDISENDILSLPEELGDLSVLTELNISENRITSLPNSISRLKKLTVLKADSNGIATLTTAIGGCTALRELYLANNQLTSVPSSLGNLEILTLLTLDENRLTEIPSTICGCQKLSILTLRNNQLKELPMEIGRLGNLNVLDLCDNQLMFLPFTTPVLSNLRALWLSVDQTVPRIPLTVAIDPVTHMKVLTCYLLPQGMGQEAAARQRRTDGNVHFGEEGEPATEEGSEHAGFVRHGTPHPKSRIRVGLRRQSIDGHLIPRNTGEEKQNLTLSLRRKSVGDTPGPIMIALPLVEHQYTESNSEASQKVLAEKQEDIHSSAKSLLYSDGKHHYISIKRKDNSGYGLAMAGGCDSEPYKKGDNGLFISKIHEGGAAESAGLCVGDKIISVNDVSVTDEYHETAVKLMQKKDTVNLVVLREKQDEEAPLFSITEVEKNEERCIEDTSVETISTSAQRDIDGSLAFSVDLVSNEDCEKRIVITSIKNDIRSDQISKLRVGDQILSINGKNVVNMSQEEATKKLEKDSEREVYLVVQRWNKSKNRSLALPNVFTEHIESELNSQKTMALASALDNIDSKERTDERLNFESSSANEVNLETDHEDLSAIEKEVIALTRKAPPVAPKPKGFKIFASAKVSMEEDRFDNLNTTEPSKLTFSSKIKKFECATQVSAMRNVENGGIPAKKPLISEYDIIKMKEEEKIKGAHLNESLLTTLGDEFEEPSFEDLIDVSSRGLKLPTIIRTKMAELRMDQLSSLLSEKSQDDYKTMKNFEKRQTWKQERYKSLEAESVKAESVMEQVHEISSHLGMVAEEVNQTAFSSDGKDIFAVNDNDENAFTKSDCSKRLLNGNITNTTTLGVS